MSALMLAFLLIVLLGILLIVTTMYFNKAIQELKLIISTLSKSRSRENAIMSLVYADFHLCSFVWLLTVLKLPDTIKEKIYEKYNVLRQTLSEIEENNDVTTVEKDALSVYEKMPELYSMLMNNKHDLFTDNDAINEKVFKYLIDNGQTTKKDLARNINETMSMTEKALTSLRKSNKVTMTYISGNLYVYEVIETEKVVNNVTL